MLLVGNLSSLTYDQVKAKLGDVSSELFARTVGTAGKESSVKEGVVNDAVQVRLLEDLFGLIIIKYV